MRILAVDTSTGMATAAVTDNGKLLSLCQSMAPKGHSQKIFGLIKRALEECESPIEAIDGFVCSVGPGSFTGLRIGATAVTGLAHGLKKKLLGLPTLDVLAAGIFQYQGYICPILDAQRNCVYGALYRWESGELRKLQDFSAIEISQLEGRILEEIQRHQTVNELPSVAFVGDGVPLHQERISTWTGIRAEIPWGDRVYPSAATSAFMAEKAWSKKSGEDEGVAAGSLRLEYIRKAQAEVEYSHRNPINIRLMKKEDVEAVHEVETLCFPTPWSEDSFHQEMENPMALYLVAEVGGRVAGYAGLWKIIDEGHITNVGVHPGYQGMGIGEKLMRELIRASIERELCQMTLEVRVSNIPAINLYKKLKFHESGIRKGYYTDTKEDGLIMWLDMKSS